MAHIFRERHLLARHERDDKEKDFDMIVIGIVKDWRAHPGAPEKTGVKIGLCHDEKEF